MSSAKKRTIVDKFLWYYFRLFVTVDKEFFRFSLTKKLCGPLAHWYVTKWPAITNRFVSPASEEHETIKVADKSIDCTLTAECSLHSKFVGALCKTEMPLYIYILAHLHLC